MNEKNKQPSPRISPVTILLGIFFCFVSFALFAVTGGNLVAGIVPIIGIGVVVALFALPLRHTYTAFVCALMLVTNPDAGPMGDRWRGPLTKMGDLFRPQLEALTGIGGLKFSVADLGIWAFTGIVVIRTILNNNIDNHLTQPAARPLKIAAIVAFGALILWSAIGILKGATPTHIIFQVRNLMGLQLCIIIAMRAFKDEKTFRLLGRLFVGLTMIRILEAAYFYYLVGLPGGYLPELEYITTHTDSFVFIGALTLLILEALEKPCFRTKRNLLLCGAAIMWAVVINDRRVAFMSLALCLFLIYFFLSPKIKRTIKNTLIKLSPVLLIYVGVGMHSSNPIFKPVQTFVSVNDAEDGSNMSRKIENYNLALTLKMSPVVGTGFGAPYHETIPAVKLGARFGDAMMYLAHNHLIWLSYLLGMTGLYLFMLPLMVGCFLAFRTRIFARNANQKIAALWAVCTVIIYLTQSYADMGSVYLKGHLLISVGFAAVANLSNRLDNS